MNSEDRFKKSLGEIVGSKSFDFDPENWDKAREMIDASKERRRASPFVLASALLILSLLTGFYFLTDSLSAEDKPVSQLKEITPASDLTPGVKKPGAKSDPASPGTLKPLQAQGTYEPVAESIKPAGSTAELPAAAPAAPAPGKISPGKKENQKTAPVSPAQPVIGADPIITSSPDAPENSAPGPQKNTNGNEIAATKNEARVAEQQAPENVKPAAEQFANETPAALPAKKELPVNETKSEALASVPAENISDIIPEKQELPMTTAAPDSAKNIRAEPVTALPADNDQGELGKPKIFPPVLFSIEAGTNYSLGWNTHGKRDAAGFNPVIGINYFNNFKPGMSLSAGLHYSSVNNLSYGTYTSKVVKLGFGEESRVTRFTPVKVHYLLVPVRFNYDVTSKNTIGIGCNVAYLLTVESDVETYSEKLNTTYDRSVTRTSGYTKGFKQFDTQVSAFYKRRLYPSLALNFEVYYGLTDVKDNSFFNSGVNERNTGLKLTLVYNFLKK